MAASKLLVTGTGRCGTTFLIQLFTRLGWDTGLVEEDGNWYTRVWQEVVTDDQGRITRVHREPPEGAVGLYPAYSERIRAGCETHVGLQDDPEAVAALPRVIKNPHIADHLDWLLGQKILKLSHAVIPVRSLHDVSMSRHELYRDVSHPRFRTLRPTLEAESAGKLGRLVAALLSRNVPHTLLAFPAFLQNPDGLWEKLYMADLFVRFGQVTPRRFLREFHALADLSKLSVREGRVLRSEACSES